MKALYLNPYADKLLRLRFASWFGKVVKWEQPWSFSWNEIPDSEELWSLNFIFLLYFVLRENSLTWEILSLHVCPTADTLLNPNSADVLSSARLLAVPISCSRGKPFVLSPFGQFSFFPSNRSVRGLSSWEMHVAGGRAKCTKRKEAQYKLRHRHLADRFDVSVTSSAGQCSCPQSEVFVIHWNSENVTGISSAEHLESSHLRSSVFERSKCSTGLRSFMPSMNIRLWGPSLCCRKLQCGHRAADIQLRNDLERLKHRSAWGRSCSHGLLSK